MGGNSKDELAGRIRSRRDELGMTQRQLAEALGVSIQSVSDWERGVSRPWENLAALAKRLEVSTDWILTGDSLLEIPSARVSVGKQKTSAIPDAPDIARIVTKLRTLPPDIRKRVEGYVDGLLDEGERGGVERKSRRA